MQTKTSERAPIHCGVCHHAHATQRCDRCSSSFCSQSICLQHFDAHVCEVQPTTMIAVKRGEREVLPIVEEEEILETPGMRESLQRTEQIEVQLNIARQFRISVLRAIGTREASKLLARPEALLQYGEHVAREYTNALAKYSLLNRETSDELLALCRLPQNELRCAVNIEMKSPFEDLHTDLPLTLRNISMLVRYKILHRDVNSFGIHKLFEIDEKPELAHGIGIGIYYSAIALHDIDLLKVLEKHMFAIGSFRLDLFAMLNIMFSFGMGMLVFFQRISLPDPRRLFTYLENLTPNTMSMMVVVKPHVIARYTSVFIGDEQNLRAINKEIFRDPNATIRWAINVLKKFITFNEEGSLLLQELIGPASLLEKSFENFLESFTLENILHDIKYLQLIPFFFFHYLSSVPERYYEKTTTTAFLMALLDRTHNFGQQRHLEPKVIDQTFTKFKDYIFRQHGKDFWQNFLRFNVRAVIGELNDVDRSIREKRREFKRMTESEINLMFSFPSLPSETIEGKEEDDEEEQRRREVEAVEEASKRKTMEEEEEEEAAAAEAKRQRLSGRTMVTRERRNVVPLPPELSEEEEEEGEPIEEESVEAFRRKWFDTAHPGVEIRRSLIPNAGVGVFATRTFQKHERITEYTGHIVPFSKIEERENELVRKGTKKAKQELEDEFSHLLDLEYEEEKGGRAIYVLDGSRDEEGNKIFDPQSQRLDRGFGVGAFLNDARNTEFRNNAQLYLLYDPRISRVPPQPARRYIAFVSAIRRIKPGEEILTFYGKKYWRKGGVPHISPTRAQKVRVRPPTPPLTPPLEPVPPLSPSTTPLAPLPRGRGTQTEPFEIDRLLSLFTIKGDFL